MAVKETLDKEILTIRDAAQYLRLSEAEIYELARTGSRLYPANLEMDRGTT